MCNSTVPKIVELWILLSFLRLIVKLKPILELVDMNSRDKSWDKAVPSKAHVRGCVIWGWPLQTASLSCLVRRKMTNYHPACWLKLAQSHRTHWGQACKICGEGKRFWGLTWARHEVMELSKRYRITWTRPGHQTWKFYKFKYFEHDLGNQSLPPPNKQSVDWQPSGKNFISACTCRLGRPQILWPWPTNLASLNGRPHRVRDQAQACKFGAPRYKNMSHYVCQRWIMELGFFLFWINFQDQTENWKSIPKKRSGTKSEAMLHRSLAHQTYCKLKFKLSVVDARQV